jgi:glycosyltransferase involved in cell wall biosynthesis
MAIELCRRWLTYASGRFALRIANTLRPFAALLVRPFAALAARPPAVHRKAVRVLYAVKYPNALSESYVRTEIEWAEAQDVEVCVWAARPHMSGYPDPRPHLRVGSEIGGAILDYRPTLIHAHWLTTACEVLSAARQHEVPLTVRGHSFDFAPERISTLVNEPLVHRVWLFPQLAARCSSAKVAPLPACFSARRYFPAPSGGRRFVFRAAAGLPGKGIEEFIAIAAACPEIPFVLAMTRATGVPDYPERLAARGVPANVTLHINLQHPEVANLMRDAAVYLRGHEPQGHPYGMPVSIAEAMACGAYLLGRHDPEAVRYIGEAGSCYHSVEDAIERLRDVWTWPEARWRAARARSLARAAAFRDDRVLGAVLSGWREVAAGRP